MTEWRHGTDTIGDSRLDLLDAASELVEVGADGTDRLGMLEGVAGRAWRWCGFGENLVTALAGFGQLHRFARPARCLALLSRRG